MDLTNNQDIDHIRLQLKDSGPDTQCHKYMHTSKMFRHVQYKYYAVKATNVSLTEKLTRSTLPLKQANKQKSSI